mgnify:CR=1 FL=1
MLAGLLSNRPQNLSNAEYATLSRLVPFRLPLLNVGRAIFVRDWEREAFERDFGLVIMDGRNNTHPVPRAKSPYYLRKGKGRADAMLWCGRPASLVLVIHLLC